MCADPVEKTECEEVAAFFGATYKQEISDSTKAGGCIINKKGNNARFNDESPAGTICGRSEELDYVYEQATLSDEPTSKPTRKPTVSITWS